MAGYNDYPPTNADMAAAIKRSINASLDPHLDNNKRRENLQILEDIKQQPSAPEVGFDLASSVNESDPVRYFGLQLLEHAIKYRWAELQDEQILQLGRWVKLCAGTLSSHDPTFYRNKVGSLWVEVAKRCWGQEWMNMDKELLYIWGRRDHNQQASAWLVCYILELLSEDICVREDPTAGLRLEVLGKSLNEIMITARVYQEHIATRGTSAQVRVEEEGVQNEGWLARLSRWMAYMAQRISITTSPPEVRARDTQSMLKALQAMRPAAAWLGFRSILEAELIASLAKAFSLRDVQISLATVEVLLSLCNRTSTDHSLSGSTQEFLVAILQNGFIEMFTETYQTTQCAPGEDDEKYTLQIKMSESLSLLAQAIATYPKFVYSNNINVDPFFSLMAKVLQSKSLTVSIPVLHSWTKVIACQNPKLVEIVSAYLGSLLQTSSERLLRYEALPEDSENETLQHLYEDIDQMPERHAFVGNYRRYCMSIIETLSRSRPVQALEFTLGQLKSTLAEGPYTADRGFNPAIYNPASYSVLVLDAQASVVAATLKGYSRWLRDTGALNTEEQYEIVSAEKAQEAAMGYLQQWTTEITSMHIDDPEVASHILSTLVSVIRTVRDPDRDFVLHVIEYMLTKSLHDDPSSSKYTDALRGFEHLRILELQKMALLFSGPLLGVYHDLEPKVNVLSARYSDDTKLVWSYKAFLFIIIHRAPASSFAPEVRMQQLQQMLQPIYEAWQDSGLGAALSNFESFCQALDMGDLPQFFMDHGFDRVGDWHAQVLNDAGRAKQKSINDRSATLPLRATKALLSASTEKLKEGSSQLDIACALWGQVIPVMLPNLLAMIKQATAFSNMQSWAHLPNDLQAVVKRTLQDRFWQSGISNESKDAFLARVAGSKDSYEGFASTVRGAARNVREHAYHLLYSMATFEEQFFSVPDFGQALADALFEDAHALSTNHLQALINLATGLVRRCPPHHAQGFLPPVLRALFTKLDGKITTEWESIRVAEQRDAEGDELTDEMRIESTLRQLTFSMVSFVPFLLAAGTQHHVNGTAGNGSSTSPIRTLVLCDLSILEPMLVFTTHALEMRDTRSCTIATKTFRDLIPAFKPDSPPAPQVREFISDHVFKACITSLHDPYFADVQRDLATVIAAVILVYFDKTEIPANILLSLPNMSHATITSAFNKLRKATSERQQRAIILALLEGVRGVSVHESGNVVKAARPAKSRSTMLAGFMEMDAQPSGIDRPDESNLEGLADLFGS